MKRILFAVDGSGVSDEMVLWATKHLLSPQDQVLLVHVHQHPDDMYVLDPSLSMNYDDAMSTVRSPISLLFLHVPPPPHFPCRLRTLSPS